MTSTGAALEQLAVVREPCQCEACHRSRRVATIRATGDLAALQKLTADLLESLVKTEQELVMERAYRGELERQLR